VERKAPLTFQEWWPGCVTRPGVFDLPVPIEGAVVVPDAVLVPPVGFGARGYRLGYGGGYFDRTLATLSPRPIAIALAREVSRIDTIHPLPHDVPMDFIVTEDGIHHVTPAGLRRLGPGEASPLAVAIRAARREARRP
jgi:5,10-methenyltetrahydrofolate synthetase